MKKSSFEPSILWAILLGMVIIFATGWEIGFWSTDSSLRVDNASLRASMPGGLTAGEERKALERREEEVKRREKEVTRREEEVTRRERDLNSTARLTGKAEGKAEQLSENNEVLKQSFDGVVWQKNILCGIQ